MRCRPRKSRPPNRGNAQRTIGEKEREEYLDFRKRQGFNVLQINALPQWDASEHTPEALPFRKTGDGEYDYSAIDDRYFDRACTFLRMARDRGFIPALVLLWYNYVPGTWASDGQRKKPMPFEAVRPYTEYVVRRFAAFDPIYIISTGKRILTPRFEKTQDGSILQICPFNSDTVLIGTL